LTRNELVALNFIILGISLFILFQLTKDSVYKKQGGIVLQILVNSGLVPSSTKYLVNSQFP
ncbi:hypothetical protein, partial [uncultured Bacteroides sp.]|uniref:hypothetical protein n=1 Tax=uncultured Bacteroides sp. TaxID=162156 RepID=UPI00258A1DF7